MRAWIHLMVESFEAPGAPAAVSLLAPSVGCHTTLQAKSAATLGWI